MAFCGYLKQSTAVDILLGPCIDDTDGKTAETGLTLDVEISMNGQALANKTDADTPVHDAAGTVDGYYNCELDATDTGTLGIITVVAHAAGFLPVRHDYQVVTANWYDTMCSTDQFDVNVTNVAGTAQTANDNGADINTLITEVGKVPKSDGAVSWNATALAAIEAEANDALEAVQLDHLLGVTTGVAADGDLETYCVAGSVMSHVLSTGADVTTFQPSTDSLEAVRNHIGDGTNLTEAGGTGDQLTAINLPNQTMDITGDITGNISGSVGSCAAATVSAIGANVITAASIAAGAIDNATFAADVGSTAYAANIIGLATRKAIDDYDPPTKSELDTAQGAVTVAAIDNIDFGATMKASINTEADNAFATYDPPTKTEMDSAFTEIKGATWASGTDTLEHIRDKQTDIETDTQAIETDTGTTLQAELDAIQAAVITNAAGVDIAADIIAIKAETATILTDTGTTLQAELDAIQAAVITNAAGVDIAADIIALKAETATILTDTGTTLQAELDGIQADTEDIQSRLPAALSSGNIKADVLAISTSTAAADNLEASAETIIPASVNDAGASTTAFITDLTSAVDDFYNGRVIIFTSGALANQATNITDYAGATKTVTVTALTAAPANSVTFVVV